jgi:hypothetical protein
MELTTLDPLGAFYLPMELFAYAQSSLYLWLTPAMPQPGRSGLTPSHTKNSKSSSVSKPICTPPFVLASAMLLNEINSKHQFGTGSLAPLNLVKELKAMFGNMITKQEIDAN